MPLWAAVLSSVALLLVAAKAHGRQVRLEREQKGVFHVDFRRSNPAAVEAIWRRDRLTFWPALAAFALAGAAAAFALAGNPSEAAWPVTLALGWAFAGAFTAAGLASWVRLSLRKEGPLPWRKRAQQGSVAWWLGVAVAGAAVLLALSL